MDKRNNLRSVLQRNVNVPKHNKRSVRNKDMKTYLWDICLIEPQNTNQTSKLFLCRHQAIKADFVSPVMIIYN
jgi:hypothetical protein